MIAWLEFSAEVIIVDGLGPGSAVLLAGIYTDTALPSLPFFTASSFFTGRAGTHNSMAEHRRKHAHCMSCICIAKRNRLCSRYFLFVLETSFEISAVNISESSFQM